MCKVIGCRGFRLDKKGNLQFDNRFAEHIFILEDPKNHHGHYIEINYPISFLEKKLKDMVTDYLNKYKNLIK